MSDLAKVKKLLESGVYTAVLCKDDHVITSDLRGVKPLLLWLENGIELRGFSAADKVVGKATAFLYVLLGIRELYSPVISRHAWQVLCEHGIHTSYDILTDYIINRSGDGICPFEELVLELSDPMTAYHAICDKMQQK